MKVFLIIWITVILSPCLLYSQGDNSCHQDIDKNYQQFRTTFEEEMNATDTLAKEETPAVPTFLSDIPGWLIGPLQAPGNTISTIGISDPGTDSAIARSQAVFRAVYLASLMTGSSLSNLVDNFDEDMDDRSRENSGQFVDYFEFNSQAPSEISGVNVLKEQYTNSGECIVLVECPITVDEQPALAFKTIGMINEFGKDGVYDCNSRIEFSGYSSSNPQAAELRYISRSINGITDLESYYMGNQLPCLQAKFKYWQPDSASQSDKTEGVKTNRGLWNAFLTSVIKAVTLEIRTQPGEIKSTSDNYEGKSELLNREAMTGSLTFHLDQILIYDNKLWAILDQIKFSQP